jgi:hypothetical protein
LQPRSVLSAGDDEQNVFLIERTSSAFSLDLRVFQEYTFPTEGCENACSFLTRLRVLKFLRVLKLLLDRKRDFLVH